MKLQIKAAAYKERGKEKLFETCRKPASTSVKSSRRAKSEAEFSIVTAFKAAQKTYFFPSSCPFSRNERRKFRLEKKKKKRLATTVSTQPKKRIYRCVHTHTVSGIVINRTRYTLSRCKQNDNGCSLYSS